MSGRKRHDGSRRRMIFPPLWHMRPAKRPAGQAPPCFYTSSVVLFRHEHATDRQVLPALPDDDARGSGRVRPLWTSVPHRPNRNDARPGPATPDAAVHSAAPPPARCARHLRSSPHAGRRLGHDDPTSEPAGLALARGSSQGADDAGEADAEGRMRAGIAKDCERCCIIQRPCHEWHG